MNTNGLIRVSCPAFARIVDDRGKFLLVRARKGGRTLLRPLGDPLRYQSARVRAELARRFQATLFEEERERALRFVVPNDQLGRVYEWFLNARADQREGDIDRILVKRLARDLGILGAQESLHLPRRLRGHARNEGVTDRTGVSVRNTAYLMDIFEVTPPRPIMAKLVKASEGPNARLAFASHREIVSNMGPGGHVSILAGALLIPPN